MCHTKKKISSVRIKNELLEKKIEKKIFQKKNTGAGKKNLCAIVAKKKEKSSRRGV